MSVKTVAKDDRSVGLLHKYGGYKLGNTNFGTKTLFLAVK